MRDVVYIKDLSIGYKQRSNQKVVHSGINATLNRGELTCLLGPNGAGKSTLLRTLSGFQPALSGTITIGDAVIGSTPMQELSKLLGVVLTERSDIENITVEEMVSMGRAPYTGFWGELSSEDRAIVADSMNLVGVGGMKSRSLQTLSDGERQKVMIAKALAQQTPVIFLDEPAAFLDLPSKIELMQLLHTLAQKSNKVIFLSTHDLDLALQSADRLWLLDQDKPLEIGTPEDLILQDKLNLFFARDGVTLDRETGLFKIDHPCSSSIDVEGTGWLTNLVCRALSRNGIRPIVDGDSSNDEDSNDKGSSDRHSYSSLRSIQVQEYNQIQELNQIQEVNSPKSTPKIIVKSTPKFIVKESGKENLLFSTIESLLKEIQSK